MKVIIDPIVKQLFFDRIQEAYGDTQNAMFWIENIAYGDVPIILKDQLLSMVDTLEENKSQKDMYKRMYYDKRKESASAREELNEMRRKIRGIEQEIESYVDEIREYRDILMAKGLNRYISEYEDDDF